LYQSLAEIFYGIKSIETELTLTRELSRLSKDRVGFLQQRVKVGRSRKSELISARAQLVSVEASIKELRSSLQRQREAFALVTNLSANSALDDQAIPKMPSELDQMLGKLGTSPWIEVRNRDVEIAEESVN